MRKAHCLLCLNPRESPNLETLLGSFSFLQKSEDLWVIQCLSYCILKTCLSHPYSYSFTSHRILGSKDFPLEHWCFYPFPCSLCDEKLVITLNVIPFWVTTFSLTTFFFFFWCSLLSLKCFYISWDLENSFTICLKNVFCHPPHCIPELLLKLFVIPSLLSLWLCSKTFLHFYFLNQ